MGLWKNMAVVLANWLDPDRRKALIADEAVRHAHLMAAQTRHTLPRSMPPKTHILTDLVDYTIVDGWICVPLDGVFDLRALPHDGRVKLMRAIAKSAEEAGAQIFSVSEMD